MDYFNKCYKLTLAPGNKKNPKQSFKEVDKIKNHKDDSVESLLKSNNVAIITGKKNDITVIDLDCQKSNFDFPFDIDEICQNTFSQKTPSGGYHLFYQYENDLMNKANNKIDVDVRNDNGYILFSGSTFKGNKYETLSNKTPSKMPKEIKDYLIKNGFEKFEKKEKIENKICSINKSEMIKDKNIYIPYTHLKEILDNKPDDYINGYDDFFKFTSCMKYLNHYELWDEYSKTKPNYHKSGNIEIWNNCDANKCNLNFLIELFDNKENQGYYQLKHTPSFTLNSMKINKQKLGYDFIQSDKNYVIKSDTGTGKTTSVKHFLHNTNNKFISIVSRVSLGEEQHNNFTQDEYLDAEFYRSKHFFENGDNIIIQIDSLMKINTKIDISEYIIVLDEFESMLDHLFTSKTLKTSRILIMIKFIQILKQCKNFICIDADITNKSIEFIEKFINRKYDLFENEYKHNKGVYAYEIEDEKDFVHKLKNQTKFLLCCDSKTEAERFKKLLDDPEVIIITSDTDRYIAFDNHNKIIYSPKVIYGIDSCMRRNVFCWYKEHTINPKKMVQQVARCRNINNLYYHFEKKRYKHNSITYKQVLDENKKIMEYGVSDDNSLLETGFSLIDPEIEKKYVKLYSKFEYEDLCYNTNKHAHFGKLLEERGVILMNYKVKTNFHILKEPEVSQEYTEEDYENFFTNINNKKILDIIGLSKNDDIVKQNFDLIKSYNFVSTYLSCKYLYFENRTDKDLQENVSSMNEFVINKVSCSKQKLRLLMHFKHCVGDTDNKQIKSNNLLDQDQISKFQIDYKNIFNKKFTKELNFKFDTLYDLDKIQSQMYKDVFGRNFIESKAYKEDKKCKYKYNINQDVFNQYKSLYDTRIKKIEAQIEHYKETIKELDRGIFID
tara:strand:+ start:799 stop:3477 length:2679 start_codon:yes stop_codon:yes gene_type:complete